MENSDITKNLFVLSILAPEAEIPSEGGDSSKWCKISIWKNSELVYLAGFCC